MERFKNQPIVEEKTHVALCQLADQLHIDSDAKWNQLVEHNRQSGSSLSIVTIIRSFVASMTNFSKGTAFGKAVVRYLKYDEEQEQKKLSQQFKGRHTLAMLRAQMAEVEEPDLDNSRELAKMEKDFEEGVEDWSQLVDVRGEPAEDKAASKKSEGPKSFDFEEDSISEEETEPSGPDDWDWGEEETDQNFLNLKDEKEQKKETARRAEILRDKPRRSSQPASSLGKNITSSSHQRFGEPESKKTIR